MTSRFTVEGTGFVGFAVFAVFETIGALAFGGVVEESGGGERARVEEAGEEEGKRFLECGQAGADGACVCFDDGPDCGGDDAPGWVG